MTITTLATPGRAATDPATAARRGPTTRARPAPTAPHLLLPPMPEPTAAPLVAALAALSRPAVRSVLSPVTDSLWPVPTPHPLPAAEPLPDPTRLCGSLVLAAVQVLNGGRPLAQLARWVSPEVFDALAERAAPACETQPATTRSGPGVSRPTVRRSPTVRRTHLSRVSPTAVEASVVVHDGARVRAAAVRLEVHRGHWRATVLQIG